MKEFVYYNMNPLQKHTCDCVPRALAFFLHKTWEEAFLSLVKYSAKNGIVSFNYRSTISSYLKEKGYVKKKPPYNGMSVGEFCENVADDEHVYLVLIKRHLTIVFKRDVFDTWDCREKDVDFYWEREKRKNS